MTITQTGPTASALLQRALTRHPGRIAFRWDGGELSYRGTAETIGRMQAVFAAAGLGRGTRVAVLAGNQVEAWCATQAAQCSGMVSTALHPLASLDDHLFQLQDFGAEVLVADGVAFGERAATLAQRHAGLQQVYTLAESGFGTPLSREIARAGEQGHLFIVDRKKDMIVSGGFNVYPRDVEDLISSHPAVAMVAVIGVPDAKWGEAVTAMVQLKPGASVDAAALIELVRQRKGKLMAPKRIEFVAELPRTAVGKIDKKQLRAPFWAGQGRQVG